jgi:hypothetical protein
MFTQFKSISDHDIFEYTCGKCHLLATSIGKIYPSYTNYYVLFTNNEVEDNIYTVLMHAIAYIPELSIFVDIRGTYETIDDIVKQFHNYRCEQHVYSVVTSDNVLFKDNKIELQLLTLIDEQWDNQAKEKADVTAKNIVKLMLHELN